MGKLNIVVFVLKDWNECVLFISVSGNISIDNYSTQLVIYFCFNNYCNWIIKKMMLPIFPKIACAKQMRHRNVIHQNSMNVDQKQIIWNLRTNKISSKRKNELMNWNIHWINVLSVMEWVIWHIINSIYIKGQRSIITVIISQKNLKAKASEIFSEKKIIQSKWRFKQCAFYWLALASFRWNKDLISISSQFSIAY